MKIINLLHFVCTKSILVLMLCLGLFTSVNSQIVFYTGAEIAYLPYNSLTGIKFSASVEKIINKNIFLFTPHLIYAIGNRDFEFKSENDYALVDESNRSAYPLPGIIPGFQQSPYLQVLNLKTAKTVDVGFSVSYGRPVFNFGNNTLNANLGLNLSWVEEVSIAYNLKGNLTNVFGTINNVYLIVPYSQNYFDLGPRLGLIYTNNPSKATSLGLMSSITWLTNTGFNYSFGPFFRIVI